MYCFECGESASWSAPLHLHPLERLSDGLREVKWFLQRGRRGWADRDVWGLDGYLARVISESVAYLEKTTIGYPTPKAEWPWPDEVGEQANREWHETLRAISGGFGSVSEGDYHVEDAEGNFVLPPIVKPEYERAKALFAEHFWSLWD